MAINYILFIIISITTVACLGGAKQEIQTITVSPSPFSPNGVSIPIRWPDATVSSSGSGMNLRHSTDIDLDFVAGDEVAGLDPVEQMMKAWNNALVGKKFFTVPVTSTTSNKEYVSLSSYNDGELGIYKHNGWFTNVSSSALAITQFFGVRRNAETSSEFIEMTHADIIFNYRDFDFKTDPADTSMYDFHTVLLHELGHFIGLGHNTSTSSSVMYPFLTASDIHRSLFAADISSLDANYDLSAGALTATGFNAGAISDPNFVSQKEGEVVQGIIELRSDGSCHHQINGNVTLIH
jgi:hypothetical protein